MSSRPVLRVGVFGGSFNPIHFGHLLVADEIVEALDLDRLLLVPAALPPHKPGSDLAPARAAMLSRAGNSGGYSAVGRTTGGFAINRS